MAEGSRVDPAGECTGSVPEGSGSPTLSPVSCIREDHGTATVFCNECGQFYCETCQDNHQLFDLMSGHRFSPVDMMSMDKVQAIWVEAAKNTCAEHRQRFSHLCKTCCSLICNTCLTATHKNHYIEEFVDIARARQHEYRRSQGEVEYFSSNYNDILADMFGQSWINTRGYFEDAKKRVAEATQQQRRLVDDRGKELLCQIATFETTVVLSAKQHRGVGVRYAKKSNQINMDSFRSVCGNVNLHVRTLELAEPLKEISLKYEGSKVVSGMAVLKDCLCLTHPEDPNLWLYDTKENNRSKTHLVPELKAPNGMTVLDKDNGTIVITDANTSGGRLHFVTISEHLDITNHRFTQISMDKPGKILLASTTRELLVAPLFGPKIWIFSADLNPRLLREVDFDFKDDRLELVSIIENKDGYILLGYKDGISTLLSVNREGKCRQLQVGGVCLQYQRGQFMIKDPEDRPLLLEHGRHRVHLVDPSKDQTHLLLTEESGITIPDCACFDQSATHLYIAYGPSKNRKARVFNWPPRSNTTPQFQLELTTPEF